MARILLCNSAVKVHDSQAYRKMDVTRECNSRILELKEIPLTSQTGFSLVNAAVVCAILESISGLEASSDTTEPGYLKVVTDSCCPFTAISSLMPLVYHQLGLLGTVTHSVIQRLRHRFANTGTPAEPRRPVRP